MSKQKSNLVSNGAVLASTPGPIFGPVEFSMPENPGVYKNRSGLSTVAMTAHVALALASGLTISASVYADLKEDGGLKIRVSLPKGIRGTDVAKLEFRKHVNEAINGWASKTAAFRGAYTRLTAPPTVKADGKSGEPIEWRPDVADDSADVDASTVAESASVN